MHSVNLMPIELRRRRFLIDRAKLWAFVSAVVFVLLVVAAESVRARVEAMQSQLASEQEFAARLARAQKLALDLTVRQTRFRDQQEVLRRMIRRGGWGEVIAEVAEAAGDAVWFQSLELRSKAPAPAALASTSAESAGTPAEEEISLTISGFALSNGDFAGFISRLNRCRRVVGAEPVNVRVGKLLQGTLVAFSVECRVVGLVEPPGPQPAAGRDPLTFRSAANAVADRLAGKVDG